MMRMTVEQFEDLHEMLKTRLQKSNMRRSLPTKLRLALALNYLAHGDSVETLSTFYYVGKSTAYGIIAEVSFCIWDVLSLRYLGMKTVEDWQKEAKKFEGRWDFPNCIGAIDGKHIGIVKPPRSGSTFFNYKKYFSFVLMGVCDAEYRFVWIDVGDYGSHSDSSVFGATRFGQELSGKRYPLPTPRRLPGISTNLPYFFIGDEAIKLSSFMMRPYSRRLVTELAQELFNYRLSRARMTIENAFGILAARWRVLHQPLVFNLLTTIEIVKALTCLQNFLLTNELNLPPQSRRYAPSRFVDRLMEDGSVIEGDWRKDLKEGKAHGVENFENEPEKEEREVETDEIGLRIREKLAFYFMVQEGYLPPSEDDIG